MKFHRIQNSRLVELLIRISSWIFRTQKEKEFLFFQQSRSFTQREIALEVEQNLQTKISNSKIHCNLWNEYVRL